MENCWTDPDRTSPDFDEYYIFLFEILAFEICLLTYGSPVRPASISPTQLALDELNTRLVVIELNEGPPDLLAHVLLLLQLEHMLAELLLQLLVGVVDAELLEAVLAERLEAVDVEHAYEGGGLHGALQTLVDLRHDPVEDRGVHVLGERVPGEQRLAQWQRGVDHFLGGLDPLVADPVSHVGLVNLKNE